jgi:hypothetical protein
MVLNALWSGKRDLNPRLQPWQGCTLPLSYSRVTDEDKPDGHKCQPNLRVSETVIYRKHTAALNGRSRQTRQNAHKN